VKRLILFYSLIYYTIITKSNCLLLNYNVMSNVDSSKPCGYFMYQEVRHSKKKTMLCPRSVPYLCFRYESQMKQVQLSYTTMIGFYNRNRLHCTVQPESLNTIQVKFGFPIGPRFGSAG